MPFAEFEETFVTRQRAGMKGLLVHPFSDPAVMAGNGTIGLEILEDLPDVDAIVVAYAGGGLACGIASAVRALNPAVRIYAAEVETGAPLAASFAAGRQVTVDYTPSFVDGISESRVVDEMWPLARSLLNGSLVVSLGEAAAAVRLIAERNRTIAEGAGAVSVAAALGRQSGRGQDRLHRIRRQRRPAEAGYDPHRPHALVTSPSTGEVRVRVTSTVPPDAPAPARCWRICHAVHRREPRVPAARERRYADAVFPLRIYADGQALPVVREHLHDAAVDEHPERKGLAVRQVYGPDLGRPREHVTPE